jgi:putative copper export protein
METFSYGLWFAVRYVHVVSVTLLAGGACIVCALCASPRAAQKSEAGLMAAVLYEWAFWLLIGVTVATGVSNLGLKGEGVLGPETTWGTALSIKLAAVLFLLMLSVVRSDLVIRLRAARPAAASERGRVALGAVYGLTVAVILGALWIGLGLAHGKY